MSQILNEVKARIQAKKHIGKVVYLSKNKKEMKISISVGGACINLLCNNTLSMYYYIYKNGTLIKTLSKLYKPPLANTLIVL
jgi:hypothetical protein